MIQNHLPHDHGQTIEHELEYMPSVENFQTVADIFKQLGDGSRIRIFWLLCHCEECVINLSAMVNMSSPAISHHLKQLKSAGLIVVSPSEESSFCDKIRINSSPVIVSFSYKYLASSCNFP